VSDDLIVAKDFLLYAPNRILLQKLSFKLKKGEILLLLGPNGSGKSTLLKELFSASLADNGSAASLSEAQIEFNKFSSVAYMPQSLNREFFIPITLEELSQLSKRSRSEALKNLLPSESSTKLWNNSSGGERQRALLVQVLSAEKEVYLLDEPFNHLDASSIEELGDFFNSLAMQGRTLIVATHTVPRSLDKGLITEVNFFPIKRDREVEAHD